MFDYARLMQRAVADMGRRAGMKAGAGVLGALAAGFLIAALWSFLAWYVGVGPMWASLIIALLFGAGAAVLWVMGSRVKHPVPSVDLLKREVEARAHLATEAALDMAKTKAREVVDVAENKVHGLIDTAKYKASSLVGDVEAKAQSFAQTTFDSASQRASSGFSSALRSVGLEGGPVDQLLETISEVRDSRAAPAVGVIGAFAVGMAVAQAFRRDDEVDAAYDWDDEYELQ